MHRKKFLQGVGLIGFGFMLEGIMGCRREADPQPDDFKQKEPSSLLNTIIEQPIKTLIVSHAYVETSNDFKKKFKTDQVLVCKLERIITTKYDFFKHYTPPSQERVKVAARLAKTYTTTMQKTFSNGNLYLVSRSMAGNNLRMPLIKSSSGILIPPGMSSMIVTPNYAREYYKNTILTHYF